MPVVFIHGVAVREQGESGWEDGRHATQGIEWPAVQAALRLHLAPVLNPDAPERVRVDRVYWGTWARSTRGAGCSAPPVRRPRRTLRLPT